MIIVKDVRNAEALCVNCDNKDKNTEKTKNVCINCNSQTGCQSDSLPACGGSMKD